MDFEKVLLVCAALIPAIVLCVYIFIKDRAEKEPVGLLFALFGLGALACIPASYIESVLLWVIDKFFTLFATEYNGELVLSGIGYRIYQIFRNFVGVALVEEGLKFLAMFFITRKNKNFNSLFDGIVYAVFVSLGFAAFENVMYVLSNGWINALVRAVTAVPGHMFNAVIMGYFYSYWHLYEKAKEKENELFQNGVITVYGSWKPEFPLADQKAGCILLPIVTHGFYDYCASMSGLVYLIVFLVFLVLLYVFCFGNIRKMSKKDNSDKSWVTTLLISKYPELKNYLLLDYITSLAKEAESKKHE